MFPYQLSLDRDNHPTSLTVVLNNKDVKAVDKSHPNWDALVQAVRDDNEAEVLKLIDIKAAVESFAAGDIAVRDNQVFFRDHQLQGLDVDHLLEFIRQKLPTAPMVAFLQNKQENPSFKAIEMMYRFVNTFGLTLTTEGYFIGFKGVQANFWSKNANKQTVVLKGRVDEDGHIFNGVGEEVEVARNCVEDNPAVGCAQGLHVGSLNYAKGWAGTDGHVMVVKVHPKDVVSVPSGEDEKMRVTHYWVVGEHEYDRTVAKESYVAPAYTDKYDNDEDDDSCPECGAELNGEDHCEFCSWESDDKHDEYCENCGALLDVGKAGFCSDCQRERDELEKIADEQLTHQPVAPVKDNSGEDRFAQGYEQGLKDGKSHLKRLYYAGDELKGGTVRRWTEGYIKGYDKGRYGK